MKVTLDKDYKEYYTLRDIERAKEVIRNCKEDTQTAADYAKTAARLLFKYKGLSHGYLDVLRAEAHTGFNSRCWNQYGDDTGKLDVIVHGIVQGLDAYVEFWANLTDIWGERPEYFAHNLARIERG